MGPPAGCLAPRSKKTQTINTNIRQLLQRLLYHCGKRLQSKLATWAADLEFPLILLPLYFGSSEVEPCSAPQGRRDPLLAALFHLPVIDGQSDHVRGRFGKYKGLLRDALFSATRATNLFVLFQHELVPAVEHLQPLGLPLPQHCVGDFFSAAERQRFMDSFTPHWLCDCVALLYCVLLCLFLVRTPESLTTVKIE